jgi:type IV secretion system protein VirB6
MSCAPLLIDDNASLASSLQSLDCQVNGAVAASYGHVFGAHGVLGAVLTTALTLYVAILALGLITGRTRLTLKALGPRVLALGFILAFATAWPAYHAVVYGLLTGGPDQVASAMLGAQSGATQAFAARLDRLFGAVFEIGQSLSVGPRSPKLDMATNLIWSSAFLILLSTLGLLVIARIILAALLALGPIFIAFGLFGATRGLFEGWLRLAVGLAFTPLLIVVGGSGLLSVLGPAIAAIGEDPAGAVERMRPIATLFGVAVIYTGLLMALAGTAIALTRGWRLPAAGAAEVSTETAHTHSVERDTQRAGVMPDLRAANDDRVGGMAAALLREETRSSDRRVEVAAEALAPSALPAQSAAAERRVAGLGQTFRPAAAGRSLSGTIGS